MTAAQGPLLRLPAEILIRVFSFFDPLTDIKALRRTIIAFRGIDFQHFRGIAEHVLQKQRDELLRAWRESRAEPLASSISAGDKVLDGIAEELIGKQYVRDSEDIESDHWVKCPWQ